MPTIKLLLPAVLSLLVWLAQPSHAEPAKPQILDGELIEDSQAPPPNQPPAPLPPVEQAATLLHEFTITLPVRPASGLVWRVHTYDRDRLQLLRHRYQRPNPPRPDGVGQQHFDFLPLKSGSTTIAFVAQPPLVRTIAQERQWRVLVK